MWHHNCITIFFEQIASQYNVEKQTQKFQYCDQHYCLHNNVTYPPNICITNKTISNAISLHSWHEAIPLSHQKKHPQLIFMYKKWLLDIASIKVSHNTSSMKIANKVSTANIDDILVQNNFSDNLYITTHTRRNFYNYNNKLVTSYSAGSTVTQVTVQNATQGWTHPCS